MLLSLINTYFSQYAPITLPLLADPALLEACSISPVTPTVSGLKWLKVEPHSSLLEEQVPLQSVQIGHGTHLLPPTSCHPLGKEPTFLTLAMEWYRCYDEFFMIREWNSCARLGYDTPCLVLKLDQDVINSALLSLRKHLLFALRASHTDCLFPGIASVLLPDL